MRHWSRRYHIAGTSRLVTGIASRSADMGIQSAVVCPIPSCIPQAIVQLVIKLGHKSQCRSHKRVAELQPRVSESVPAMAAGFKQVTEVEDKAPASKSFSFSFGLPAGSPEDAAPAAAPASADAGTAASVPVATHAPDPPPASDAQPASAR